MTLTWHCVWTVLKNMNIQMELWAIYEVIYEVIFLRWYFYSEVSLMMVYYFKMVLMQRCLNVCQLICTIYRPIYICIYLSLFGNKFYFLLDKIQIISKLHSKQKTSKGHKTPAGLNPLEGGLLVVSFEVRSHKFQRRIFRWRQLIGWQD
jgi:hypothetical protein